jgi:hypothetical protein
MITTRLPPQTGNSHLKVHADEFACINEWDACAYSILKYLTRHTMKNGAEDLKKARDFVERRLILDRAGKITWPLAPQMAMDTYIRLNDLRGSTAESLRALENFVFHLDIVDTGKALIALIDEMIRWQTPLDLRGHSKSSNSRVDNRRSARA